VLIARFVLRLPAAFPLSPLAAALLALANLSCPAVTVTVRYSMLSEPMVALIAVDVFSSPAAVMIELTAAESVSCAVNNATGAVISSEQNALDRSVAMLQSRVTPRLPSEVSACHVVEP
jgi:hypothetical protein